MDDYGIKGQDAPELRVEYWVDSDGNEISPVKLSDYKGKVVILFCWQRWCTGCHSHGFPNLKVIYDKYKDNDKLVFLGIQTVFEGFDANTKEKLKDEQEDWDLRIPMGHDPGGGTAEDSSYTMQDYHSGGTPWYIVVDKEGKVVFNNFKIFTEFFSEFLDGLL